MIQNQKIKVADFGLAKQFSITTTNFNYQDGGGKLLYMAPERIDDEEYSFPSDLWYLNM